MVIESPTQRPVARLCAIVVGLMWLVSPRTCFAGQRDVPDAARLSALIRDLGSDDFKARQDAERGLKRCPRSALPALMEHHDSDDPEIRMRIRRIVRHVRLDLGRIPQAFFVFGTQDRSGWKRLMAGWRAKATVAAKHTEGTAGGNYTAFAQSFIPRCKQIAAVELCTYPVSGLGWIRVDICEDDDGKPGEYVLSRAWLKVEKPCPVPHGGFMVFDIPDITVHPKKTYWLTYAEYVAKDSPIQSITNLGLSQGATYSEGKLMRRHEARPSGRHDARFRIVSKCGKVPTLRQVKEGALGKLGDHSSAGANWHDASLQWYRFLHK